MDQSLKKRNRDIRNETKKKKEKKRKDRENNKKPIIRKFYKKLFCLKLYAVRVCNQVNVSGGKTE